MDNIPIEALHESWLNGYEALSREYLKLVHPGPEELVIVYDLLDDGDIKILSEFIVPSGFAELNVVMARHCLAGLISTPQTIHILNKAASQKEYDTSETLPEATFSLCSLLTSSFPKNLEIDYFKADNGGIIVGSSFDVQTVLGDLGHKNVMHMAFSGLGVILMREVRKGISPLSPDKDVVSQSAHLYMSVFRRKP